MKSPRYSIIMLLTLIFINLALIIKSCLLAGKRDAVRDR